MSEINTHLDGFSLHLNVLWGLKASSVSNYRGMVEEFFAWLAGNADLRPVDQLGRKDVEAFLEWCYYPVPGIRRGNSNQTRLTKLIALRKYSRYLVYEGIIPRDFTADVPKPKVRPRFIPTFAQEEHRAFFRAIDPTKEKGLRDIVIFILAGFCGLRAGEIWRLPLEYIQDDGKLIDVIVSDDIAKQAGRGTQGRTVDLWAVPSRYVRHYVAIRYRQGARPSDPLLITYRNKRPSDRPLNDAMLDSVIKHYAAKAGIRKSKKTLHMFRATHACECRHVKGYDTGAISLRLGHKSIATTDRYLKDRRRISRVYNSFAECYRWFATVWEPSKTEGGLDGGNAREKQPLE